MTPERPFNRPESRPGKLLFRLIGWFEQRVREASRVGLGPFFEESSFPWLSSLQFQWQAIRDEAETVLAQRARLPAFQDISREVGFITRDDQWKTFMLLGYGLRSEANLAACPATARALRRIPGLRTAFFSILEPGKRIPPHRGPYNGVLRLHLALIVPEPAESCWIRVGDQQRHWQPGGVLLFDDSLEHEVHNDTSGLRVVLFVDILRPCRWPIGMLNRMIVYLARFSPLVQGAKKNQRNWERTFYRDPASLE